MVDVGWLMVTIVSCVFSNSDGLYSNGDSKMNVWSGASGESWACVFRFTSKYLKSKLKHTNPV